jgi:peptidoglycan hydrolase-like protein with peptidoglycan-binding domain
LMTSVQVALKALGYGGWGKVDGYRGDKTGAVVKEFQKAVNKAAWKAVLKVDGVISKKRITEMK